MTSLLDQRTTATLAAALQSLMRGERIPGADDVAPFRAVSSLGRIAIDDADIVAPSADRIVLRGSADPALKWCVGESWEEMLREGTFHAHFGWPDEDGRVESARTVAFTAEELHAMPAIYAAALAEGQYPGGGAKIDVNHALSSFLGGTAYKATQARARVAELRVVTDPVRGAILEGRWLWTQAGVDSIDGGDFVGCSVELIPPAFAISKIPTEDGGTRQLGGWLFDGATLCNDPMIPGMRDIGGPVAVGALVTDAASLNRAPTEGFRGPLLLSARCRWGLQTPPPPEDRMSFSNRLLTLLALTASATADDVDGAVAGLVGRAETAERDVERLSASIEVLTAERDTVREQHAALSAENARLGEDRYQALCARFIEEGRIQPATCRDPERGASAFRNAFTRGGDTFDERVSHLEALFASGTHRQVETGRKSDPDPERATSLTAADASAEIDRRLKAQGTDRTNYAAYRAVHAAVAADPRFAPTFKGGDA